MELKDPGPSAALSITAVNRAGKAKAKSLKRITASSIHPFRADAVKPRGMPIKAPSPMAARETAIEFHAPTINIESTSLPK